MLDLNVYEDPRLDAFRLSLSFTDISSSIASTSDIASSTFRLFSLSELSDWLVSRLELSNSPTDVLSSAESISAKISPSLLESMSVSAALMDPIANISTINNPNNGIILLEFICCHTSFLESLVYKFPIRIIYMIILVYQSNFTKN